MRDDPHRSIATARGEHLLGPEPVLVARSAAAAATPAKSLADRVATTVEPGSDAPAAGSPGDALTRLKDRASRALFDRLGTRLNDPDLTEEQLHAMVRTELSAAANEQTALSGEEAPAADRARSPTTCSATARCSGSRRPDVTEIMVNGHGPDLRRARRPARP